MHFQQHRKRFLIAGVTIALSAAGLFFFFSAKREPLPIEDSTDVVQLEEPSEQGTTVAALPQPQVPRPNADDAPTDMDRMEEEQYVSQLSEKAGGFLPLSAEQFKRLGYWDESIKRMEEEILLQNTQGFIPVAQALPPERVLRQSDNGNEEPPAPGTLTNPEDLKLAFQPTSLDGTLFKASTYLGGEAAGGMQGDRATTVAHYVEFADLGTVRLEESYAGQGAHGRWYLRDSFNETINGNPAVYTVRVDPTGAAETRLQWSNHNHIYDLTMRRNAAEDPTMKAKFLALARSLPTPLADDTSSGVRSEPTAPK